MVDNVTSSIMAFRDCTGYPLTCSNAEALQWYNKAVFAYVTLAESPVSMFQKALELDNSLVHAHCLMGFIMLRTLKGPNDPKVSPHLDAIKQAVSDSGDKLTEREHAYIRAVQAYASGSLFNLTEELVKMLYDYPLDILAIWIATLAYGAIGEFVRLRDMVARALPFWTEDMEYYPFTLSCYSFGLEECRERDLAEQVARKALAMNKKNPFASHALAHVIEEARDPTTGIELLISTRGDWTGILQGHITWHLTLFYFDLGDMESMFREFDNELFENATPDNRLGLLDASSLLWRLNCLGIDPGEKRWQRVSDAVAKHVNNDSHRSPWFDTHIMMGLAHGKVTEHPARLALAKEMLKAMENYTKMEGASNCCLIEKLGVPVCNALLAFGEEKYDEVLQIMLPLRYDFLSFGGSWAQRQVFSTTIIQSAINANKLQLAFELVSELKHQKPWGKRLEKLFQELKSACEKAHTPTYIKL